MIERDQTDFLKKGIEIVTNRGKNMLFEILGSLIEAAEDTAKEAEDLQRRCELNYAFYSEKVDEWEWDEDRLRSEYKAACEDNDIVLKTAFYKILQDKGLMQS